MAVYKLYLKLIGTQVQDQSKQAGGIGNRPAARYTSGTQDRKP
jgi:hypothetical protein